MSKDKEKTKSEDKFILQLKEIVEKLKERNKNIKKPVIKLSQAS